MRRGEEGREEEGRGGRREGEGEEEGEGGLGRNEEGEGKGGDGGRNKLWYIIMLTTLKEINA